MEESSLVATGGSLLLGGVLAFLVYYLVGRWLRRNATPTSKNAAAEQRNQQQQQQQKQSEVSGNQEAAAAANKRQAKSKKRREAQQEFSHPWMVGALKGHTAPILDMDFSANGKFLASCAEDCGLMPTKKELKKLETVSTAAISAKASRNSVANESKAMSSPTSPPSPSSSSTKSSSSSSSSATDKEDNQHRAILSRRQRKNRTRTPREQRRELREREDYEDDHNGPPPPNLSPAPSRNRGHHRETSKSNKTTSAQAEHKKSNGKAPKQQKKGSNTDATSNKNATSVDNKKAKSSQTTSSVTKPSQLDNLSDAALALLLRRYTLTGDQLAHFGYPVEFNNLPGYVIIINYQQHPLSLRSQHRQFSQYHYQHQRQHHLDVNAREFIPNSWNSNWNSSIITEGADADSGNGSASSSSSSLENSDQEQESSDSEKNNDAAETTQTSVTYNQQQQQRLPSVSSKFVDYESHTAIERRCARCYRSFLVNRESGEYLAEDKCSYHWGKLRSPIDGSPHVDDTWECCGARESSRGCSTAKAHVWTGIVPGYNGPFDDYVRTRPARQVARDGNYGVYALDCEMCFTKRGLELGKVTVVSVTGKMVYEALVKPDVEIIDYNTRFSGLRAKDLSKATKRLRDVQKDITSFVHAETILIGHGLENDLRALRILHPTVIDTCVAFPHFLGYPYRSSLKTLARTVLRKEIQVKEHDSAEDARIAVDLILKRLQHDLF